MSDEDELRAFSEQIHTILGKIAKMPKGEFQLGRILRKMDDAIKLDRHTKNEIKFMRLNRRGFARAMRVVLEHNERPKSADELQDAAIALALFGYRIGLSAESPDDLIGDPKFRTAHRRRLGKLGNSKKTVKSQEWKDRLSKAHETMKHTLRGSLTNEAVFERLKPCLGSIDFPVKDRTILKEIAKLRRS